MTPAIQNLVTTLTAARDAYYNGTTTMTDAKFDALEDELRKLDPSNAFFKKIGAPVNGAWPKVAHAIPMSSLNKAQVAAETADWLRDCGTVDNVVIMDKLDGLSIALKYENRKLVQALTRGDGTTGEDITRNVLLMQGAVKMLPPGSPSPTYIRGEIVCKKSDFKAHFPGESNPRNTASGTAKRQSDYQKAAYLTVIAYEWLPNGVAPASKAAELHSLNSRGFQTPVWSNVRATAATIEAEYQKYIKTDRAALDYDIDGLVICVNDEKTRANLGDLNNRPKGAIAYKFPHEQKPTVLRNIRWQVGNSGRITPVAEFDSVNLAGANVVQASLHNISNITALCADKRVTGFSAGDSILVARRNDVIPYLEELLVPNPKGTILTTPTNCPSCNGALTRDGEYLVCRSLDCEAQASGAVKRWVEKIGVLHVGDSLIEAMVEAGVVADAADLYTLDAQTVADLEIGGRKVGGSAAKAINNLRAKMTLPLHVVVGSVGIPMIGRSMAKTIVDAGFNSLSKLLKAKVADIADIPGVGPSKAQAFVVGYQIKVGLIAKLLANGIVIQNVSGPLLGKSFCLTGFRDAELQDAIEKNGGTVKSGVSKDLTYLIAQDPSSTSGKAQKARLYGTTVIGVDDAWDLIGGKV